MFLKTCFLLVIVVIAYLPYKGKNFKSVNWRTVTVLSSLFFLASTFLVAVTYPKLYVKFDFVTVGIFAVISLIWICIPKIIRHFGRYPKVFLENKGNATRFMARLEPKTITIKYFEVLFQQAIFLFIFFGILENLPIFKSLFLFTAIVVIFHLGNVFFMHIKWALIYFVLSIPMAILFGYMISQGLVLFAASTHLAFYLVFNARHWFPEKRE